MKNTPGGRKTIFRIFDISNNHILSRDITSNTVKVSLS